MPALDETQIALAHDPGNDAQHAAAHHQAEDPKHQDQHPAVRFDAAGRGVVEVVKLVGHGGFREAAHSVRSDSVYRVNPLSVSVVAAVSWSSTWIARAVSPPGPTPIIRG